MFNPRIPRDIREFIIASDKRIEAKKLGKINWKYWIHFLKFCAAKKKFKS